MISPRLPISRRLSPSPFETKGEESGRPPIQSSGPVNRRADTRTRVHLNRHGGWSSNGMRRFRGGVGVSRFGMCCDGRSGKRTGGKSLLGWVRSCHLFRLETKVFRGLRPESGPVGPQPLRLFDRKPSQDRDCAENRRLRDRGLFLRPVSMTFCIGFDLSFRASRAGNRENVPGS
jgi:hypothetical protein